MGAKCEADKSSYKLKGRSAKGPGELGVRVRRAKRVNKLEVSPFPTAGTVHNQSVIVDKSGQTNQATREPSRQARIGHGRDE